MDGFVLRLVLFAAFSALISSASAGPVCRPTLSITQTAFSEMQPPNMERRWTAAVTVAASKCAAKAGYFKIGFLREKENSYPLEFREEFIWMEPLSLVSVDVSADEAIDRVWIDSIEPCPCADERR